MNVISSGVAWDIWLIFLVLGVVVPWRGRLRMRELLAKPEVGSGERIRLYLSTIAFQWVAVGVVAWRATAHGLRWRDLGIVPPNPTTIIAAVAGAGVFGTLQWFNLRRLRRAKAARVHPLRNLARAIMPQSRRELIVFFGLAVTAGVCEEFLYRGFAVAVFARLGLHASAVVAVSSALFGLAHLYQGRGGLVGTMILGIAFGTMRVTYGSLVPVVLWHTAVDVVAGLAGPRYLLPGNTPRQLVSYV
jgi:membrane protease YdiL (CAAX protease family)